MNGTETNMWPAGVVTRSMRGRWSDGVASFFRLDHVVAQRLLGVHEGFVDRGAHGDDAPAGLGR